LVKTIPGVEELPTKLTRLIRTTKNGLVYRIREPALEPVPEYPIGLGSLIALIN
jgi:hypothetical protein